MYRINLNVSKENRLDVEEVNVKSRGNSQARQMKKLTDKKDSVLLLVNIFHRKRDDRVQGKKLLDFHCNSCRSF